MGVYAYVYVITRGIMHIDFFSERCNSKPKFKFQNIIVKNILFHIKFYLSKSEFAKSHITH